MNEKKRSGTALVSIFMGSESDWPVMQETAMTLEKFGIACEVRIISAHRTPDAAAEAAATARERGVKVIIAAAGMAAHLAGVLAAHTTLPVIGVPLKGGALDGLDAMLSTAQMPAGVPVATVALGKAGAINAAILAAQILALSDPSLEAKLLEHKRAMREKVLEADARIRAERNSL